MTIDEAIEHAREVSTEQKRRTGICVQNDNECDKFSECLNCAKEHEQLADWLEQLKEYQQLEKQGRLLKLPCKIGDDVYYVPSKVNYKLNILNKHSENNKVYNQKVEDFVLTRHGWYLECDQDVKYGTGHILTDVSFGKTWFLTKSEAEAKLKELRGDEQCAKN